MNSFKQQPVGRSVLYLNDFHYGKHLGLLNRVSFRSPDEVTRLAEFIYDVEQNSGRAKAAKLLRTWYHIKRQAS
jgi:hypothetical protein